MTVCFRKPEWLTANITERSLLPHLPVKLKYLMINKNCHEENMELSEYMPTEKYLSIPKVSIESLPLQKNNNIKILIVVPTSTIDPNAMLIKESIDAIYDQASTFRNNWEFEILVILNGPNQQETWDSLKKIHKIYMEKANDGFVTITYIPYEHNIGMVQSKTNPYNLAISYAILKSFDIFINIDDDVLLFKNNLSKCLEFLIEKTIQLNAQVIVGGENRLLRLKNPTMWERIHIKSNHVFMKGKGTNLCAWVKSLPFIPVDAGNEDYLLTRLFGEKRIFLVPNAFVEIRSAGTFFHYLKQQIRLKWNDAAANRYIKGSNDESFLLPILKTIPKFKNQRTSLIQWVCISILTGVHVYSALHVKITILFRNIFNKPIKHIDWLSSVHYNTKLIQRNKREIFFYE